MIIHLTVMVDYLFKNMNYKEDILVKNFSININVLKTCHLSGVKKEVSSLSTCIFPDKTIYPINETMLHNDPPHHSNNAYAYVKRLLEIQSKAYQEQYDKGFIYVIPTNIYVMNDNYSLEIGFILQKKITKIL